MNEATQRVLRSLELVHESSSAYLSSNENEGQEQVFGGQLIAQSLRAASLTQKDSKRIASLHLSFLSRAELQAPLKFRVDVIRDGSSFTRSHVYASQNDDLRATALITFNQSSHGLEHQATMPVVPGPQECADLAAVEQIYRKYYPNDLGVAANSTALPVQSVDMRFVDPDSLLQPEGESTNQMVWVRFAQVLEPDLELHKVILGYMSDQSIAHIALQPHALGAYNPKLRFLSIDHSISFHRPMRADDWLLLVRCCESLTQGLALVTGSFYSKDGSLVASMSQTAYIRVNE
jgi:acyl-CoA thioesterase II